jgi:hypothetical protein
MSISAATTSDLPEKTPTKPKKIKLNPSGILDVTQNLGELESDVAARKELVGKVKAAALGMDLPPLPPAPGRKSTRKALSKKSLSRSGTHRVQKRQAKKKRMLDDALAELD